MEYGINLIFLPPQQQLVRIEIFLNINTWRINGAIVLETWSNMTPKYSTNFYIISRHCEWEDCKIDTTRHNAISTMSSDPALSGSNISDEHTLLSPYTLGVAASFLVAASYTIAIRHTVVWYYVHVMTMYNVYLCIEFLYFSCFTLCLYLFLPVLGKTFHSYQIYKNQKLI